ncbi:uncharacterized protein LOC111088419 [Limulus polyphemus]|uniref:Uncharacterized protein LOC111088419 n=1 Tax=Limulus polyphemus TaxID=6850 RepID=A0ABM1TE89_LIMPO|nr:uncharacterized protein LOC111088419 [Limulus polyphemus]
MSLLSRPLDHGDPKTPMAWRHRDIIFHAAKPPPIPPKNYQSDSSLVSSTSSGEEERQRKYLDTVYRDFTPALSHNEMKRFKPFHSRTLSDVPSLNSNCRYGSTCPVRDPNRFRSYDSMLNLRDQEYRQRFLLDCKSFSKRESKRFNQSKSQPPPLPPRVNPPTHSVLSPTFLPVTHPPTLLCPGAAGMIHSPARDVIMKNGQFSKSTGKFQEDPFDVKQVCCQGHIAVLWIILAVITCGVILGIMLGAILA